MTLINKPLLFLRMETIKMKQTVRLKKLREDAMICCLAHNSSGVILLVVMRQR